MTSLSLSNGFRMREVPVSIAEYDFVIKALSESLVNPLLAFLFFVSFGIGTFLDVLSDWMNAECTITAMCGSSSCRHEVHALCRLGKLSK